MDVDIHVSALYLDLVMTQLQQSGMEHKSVPDAQYMCLFKNVCTVLHFF